MNKNIVDKLSQRKSSFYYYHVNNTEYSNTTITIAATKNILHN